MLAVHPFSLLHGRRNWFAGRGRGSRQSAVDDPVRHVKWQVLGARHDTPPHGKMTSISYYHIDSFASELFKGNPAGVCLLSAFPADAVMQKIAAENRHSETAFVVARADGDFDLRWFTPVVEDGLCGHATLASAYALSLEGHDTWPVRFHTISGLLTVNRDHERFEMDFPSRPAVSCEIPTGLLSALGLEMAEVMRDPRDFLIVVDHAEIVRNLKPDIAALAKIDMGISGGAIVTAS